MPAKDVVEMPAGCSAVGNHSDAVKIVAAAAVPPGHTAVALHVFSDVELGVVALGVAAAVPTGSGMSWPDDDDAPGKSVAVRVPAWTSCWRGGQKSAATKVSCGTYAG